MVVGPSTSVTVGRCCPVATALKKSGDWPSTKRVMERSRTFALPAPPPTPPLTVPLFSAPQDHTATGKDPNGDGITSVPTGGIIGSATAVPAAVKARMENATATRWIIFMVAPV